MPGENINDWSITAANNGTADTSINFAEGQPRASVNNSARSMMAAHAKQRDLLNGSIVTTGTANAQAFVSGIGYTATIPTGIRAMLKVGAGLTNAAGVMTLSMDAIAATPVKTRSGIDPLGGEFVAGGYVEVRYDGTNWILLTDGKEKVNKSGDTMTGALTVPSLTASGNITLTGGLVSGNVITGGTLQAGRMVLVDNGTFTQLQFAGPTFAFTLTSNIAITFSGVQTHVFFANGDFGIGGVLIGSDARLKNVIGDYSGGLEAVKNLRPVRYKLKADANGRERVGMVAQEAEQVMPELVTRVDDMRMIDPSTLTHALVNCIKELAARIEALEAR